MRYTIYICCEIDVANWKFIGKLSFSETAKNLDWFLSVECPWAKCPHCGLVIAPYPYLGNKIIFVAFGSLGPNQSTLDRHVTFPVYFNGVPLRVWSLIPHADVIWHFLCNPMKVEFPGSFNFIFVRVYVSWYSSWFLVKFGMKQI